MADYAISNVPRRVVYTASGVGPYAFTFEILVNTDVAVYRDDTLLTLTTDYSVAIAANGTGTVTLVATPTGATQIAIVGSRAIQRTSDFVTGGDFFANTVNDELDSLTIFAQQNAEGLARAMQAPQTDPIGIDMTLPRASERADKYLSFDEEGNPVAGVGRVELEAVYAIRFEIQAVAAIDDEVVIVANNDANVTTVAGISGNVTTVAGIAPNVTTVAGISGNVTSVADNATNINTVAGSIANVNTVGTNIANVNTVSGISSDVTTVAGVSANVTTVAGISANVTTVAGNNANVTTVAGVSSNVTTVATNIANVNTTAGSIANVNAVGTDIASVNTNATNIASINTNAANIVDIQNASANALAVSNAVAQVQDGVKDRFVGGTNYTIGTTTQLTLSATPLKAQTVHVYFFGVYQEKTTYTLAGNVITFGAAIAASSVEVTFDVGRSFAELDAAVAAADVDAIAAAASAAAALVSEGNAETAKDAAEDAQTAAEAAQLAAETARDQAFSNSDIYPDIATALAATVDGDYFGVPGTGNTYISLYRNDSGAATFINALYGVPKIDEMEDTQTTTAFVQAAAISQLQARLAPSIVFPN
jgi:hypothetical protein